MVKKHNRIRMIYNQTENQIIANVTRLALQKEEKKKEQKSTRALILHIFCDRNFFCVYIFTIFHRLHS